MDSARPLHVGVAVVLTAVAVGFFSGVRGTARDVTLPQSPRPPAVAGSARNYADERANRYGPNAGMYDGAFVRLAAAHPGVLDPVTQTPEEREATLAKRKSRRAFDGAPPTIPHRITQIGPPDCVACHESGAKIGDLVAPRMSHQSYTSCTQCHAVMVDPRPASETPKAPETTFEGISSWGKGTRAWPGAPPTIPHPTLMRSECTSCHGVFGAPGIKSPHPYRQSCTQCHVANAANDQHPSVGVSLGPGGAMP
jgi:cytochrome c-type protein NapB